MMNKIDLLILQGPPGAGKSTIARVISEQLNKQDCPNAILELDDLAKIYPISLVSIMYKNLAAIWPNYLALNQIKIIIPTYMQSGEREIILKVAPAKHTTICEINVPVSELELRIKAREQNPSVKKRLLGYVSNYSINRTADDFIDFQFTNYNVPPREISLEIMKKISWLQRKS
jgi:predicted kinase